MKKKLFLIPLLTLLFAISCSENDEFIISDSDKITVVADNLYYGETQLTAEQRYWVVLANRDQESSAHDAIAWYVNGQLMGNGVEFNFTPNMAGEYAISYVVSSGYSATGVEVSGSAVTSTYSSDGVVILNEPNMSGSEQIRGVNKHTFGSSVVERFITGDYSSFGATNQYIASWAGKLYNLSPFPMGGIFFSQFTANDGAFLNAIPDGVVSGQGRAFAGITPEMGILTTTKGAYIVNLTDLTVSSDILNGSDNSSSLIVADGYLFIIAGDKVKAYPVDGLSTTTLPTTLGSAKVGFVESKDGFIWAANDGVLLSIDTRDLSIQNVTLPNDAKIKALDRTWKQCTWVASTSENAFFFNNGNKEVSKYNIDAGRLIQQFISAAESFVGYSLYGTALFYDAQRDEVICSALKIGDYAYNGLFIFDAKRGDKRYEVLYNTNADGGSDEYHDMWFPAMMAPNKRY